MKKKKYFVTFALDASFTVNVEATSEEEAKELALEEALPPTLCHHCSRKLSIGDIGEVIEAGEE